MRILHISNFVQRHKGRLFWNHAFKISNGFIRNGHSVYNFSDRDVSKINLINKFNNEKNTNTDLISTFKNYNPDLLVIGHADKIHNITILKLKKKPIKKTREIDLYSPEYLAKKHGITLDDVYSDNKSISNKKVSFGFYNSLILFIVLIIALSKSLYFFQDFIVLNLPFTEFYLDYFFENIRNIFEIWKNLISNY